MDRECNHPRRAPRENDLRLADVHRVVESARTDEDGLLAEDSGAFLSALDHALRGDPGCVEPSDWRKGREKAFEEYRGL